MASLSNQDQIKTKLQNLRDVPVAVASDADLKLLTDYLLGPSLQRRPNAPHKPFEHWFCSHADPLTIEVATFLIRLHAYNNARVNIWRQQLRECLARCCECVRAFQEVKTTSRNTYFAAFSEEILQGFYGDFDNWELEVLLDGLKKFQLSPETAAGSGRALSDVPPAILYHIFYNLRILRDPGAAKIIHSCIPDVPISSWPIDFPPPGLFLMLIDGHPGVRNWAQQQISLCKQTPIPKGHFSPMHRRILKSVTDVVMSAQAANEIQHEYPMSFVSDASLMWSGYCMVLRYVPVEFFHTGNLDLRHVVVGHLHDTGPHFVDVLKSFLLVLSRIGPAMWEDEGPEYPQVVFNSIKDNPCYVQTLQELPSARKDNWLLSWTETYLNTIGNLPVVKDVLPVLVHFLCEELQHERFQGVRPAAMSIASKLLIAVITALDKYNPAPWSDTVWEIMDVHSSMVVSVAFARAYADDRWSEARTQARRLVKLSLVKDVKDICTVISKLCGRTSEHSQLFAPVVREQMWKDMYNDIQPSDSDGIAMIVSTLAAISHVDDLKDVAFVDGLADREHGNSFRSALVGVNRCLNIVRGGFEDAVTRYLDLSLPSVVVDLLRRQDVVKNVTVLMLSPVEAIQETAQALAGLAFDVEVRLDCFRALLEKFPDAALGGINEFLQTYIQYVDVVPEACSLSKALARCLTDVIDVLCSNPHGLLHSEQFLKMGVGTSVSTQLFKWWNMMTKALRAIFLKTPKWATYFDNADMVLWMRDALIFGRDMLAQRRVIEVGALAHSQQSSDGTRKNLSRVGKRMIDDLQPVLFELTRWLRLTDEELLHQSFALLESLLGCFNEACVRPSDEALQKLQKHIDNARKNDPRRPQTRLDSTRLARLQDVISAFDEDEVQIISHNLPEGKPATTMDTLKQKERKDTIASRRTEMRKSFVEPKADKKMKLPAKASISSFFTAEDKKKLETVSSVPQTASSSRAARDVRAIGNQPHRIIKDESGSVKTSTPESSSSSEHEESSDDEGGVGLASLSKLQRTPTIKKPVERRQVVLLDVPTKARNLAIERANKREDARRTHLRLKPDVSGLHRTLLSWDYDHDGPSPPGAFPNLSMVPGKFTDPHHFCRVFEPMLFLECWTQLAESKEEVRDTYECRIASRQFVDDWVDIDISISESVKKDWSLSDTDVVLLRHTNTNKSALGKAQSYKATPFGIQATIRFCLRGNDPGLHINTNWLLSKVLSLRTLHREYAALMAMPYYDLCDTILRAEIRPSRVSDFKEVQRMMVTYNVNEPQATAILSSLQAEGFALIQGPPGTGKTSTICGLVHAFLSRRSRPITTVHVGRNAGPSYKEPVKKVLLCAPSNAAIDEIAYRLKEGISGAGQRTTCPKVVRVGAVSSMNISVRDVSLEHLIEQKLNTNPELSNTSKDAGSEIARLRSELESVKRSRQQKLEEIGKIHDNAARTFALEEEIKKLNKQKVLLTHQFDKLKDKQKSDSRTLDATRRRFRTEVLQEADIICSTLSGAAYEYLEQLDFELVIIDEAAQAIELSSLIPLKYRCDRCVMVGDPKQLPPTVKSQEACKYGYNQSLFVRLQQQCPDAVHLLSIQYRMHPDISRVPSRLFYDGRLQDGPDMAIKTKRPWHPHPKLGTYRFFNVVGGQQEIGSGGTHSLVNRAECQVAVALYNRLRQEFSFFDFDFKVGIISMYRGQIFELRRAFEQRFGRDITGTVDFNTVDGFQGQEKDVIILSCVRAGPGVQSVGFLKDVRRMNVALTRAKSSLFVLGHAPTLERSDDTWRDIVRDARTRNCLVDQVDVAYFTSPVVPMKSMSSPTKPVKVRSRNELPPIPTDLTTPREFKSHLGDTPSEASKPPKEASSSNIAVAAGEEDPSKSLAGQKRPISDEPQVAPRPQQGNDQTKPKPRPKKRPKQAPSLFIPKNKRPAPEGGDTGSASNRRRL